MKEVENLSGKYAFVISSPDDQSFVRYSTHIGPVDDIGVMRSSRSYWIYAGLLDIFESHGVTFNLNSFLAPRLTQLLIFELSQEEFERHVIMENI